MSLTKKIEGKRVMKAIENWYGVNKTTPERWFDRWEDFLVHLMVEVGYYLQLNEPIKKKRGQCWIKEIRFKHEHLDNVTIYLCRNRRQVGGHLDFHYGPTYNVYPIDTLSQSNYEVMSRQQVGDKILNHIREGWSKDKDVNQED